MQPGIYIPILVPFWRTQPWFYQVVMQLMAIGLYVSTIREEYFDSCENQFYVEELQAGYQLLALGPAEHRSFRLCNRDWKLLTWAIT